MSAKLTKANLKSPFHRSRLKDKRLVGARKDKRTSFNILSLPLRYYLVRFKKRTHWCTAFIVGALDQRSRRAYRQSLKTREANDPNFLKESIYIVNRLHHPVQVQTLVYLQTLKQDIIYLTHSLPEHIGRILGTHIILIESNHMGNNAKLTCNGNCELHRLSTFHKWPTVPITFSPIQLAKWGFLYSGNGDEVICFACGTRLSGWNANDNPLERHKQSAPNCPFVRGDATGNIALNIGEVGEKFKNLMATTTDNADLDTDRAVQRNKHPTGMTKLLCLAIDRARKKGLLTSDVDLQLDRSKPDFDQLRQEVERLRTFYDWPASALADPEDLARAGFFYTGAEDRVQCAFCRGFVRNWLSTDIPEAEHKRHFPECLYVRGEEVGNFPKLVPNSIAADWRIGNQSDAQLQNGVATQELIREGAPSRTPYSFAADWRTENQSDAQSLNRVSTPTLIREGAPSSILGQIRSLATPRLTEQPKYPDYAAVESRTQSFRNQKVSPGQTAQGLAEAGWFFVGPGDKVLCFQCGGNLKDWEPEDDPWKEHKTWYPRCAYVEAYTPEPRIQSQPAPQRRTENQQDSSSRVYYIEPREIKARMDTPTVRAILDMGFSKDAVKMALEHRLSTTGDDFPNAESLLEALFRLEEAGTHTKTPAFGQNSNHAAENLSMTSGHNSTATARYSHDSISDNQPESASLPPNISASSAAIASEFQSLIPMTSENITASVGVAVATTGNELVAEGQSKAKGKRKRNKKKKQPSAATGGEDGRSADTALLAEAPNDQENVEGDLNLEDITDEEAVRFQEENRQLREARTCKPSMAMIRIHETYIRW